MRALVAMSGGVDSSVAAALTLDAGLDAVGVTLKQWVGPDGAMPTSGCCTVEDAEDARRVAAQLDIPYYVLDYTEEFREAVVDRFGAEYGAGRTPNPCIECNRRVRFRALLDHADRLDCDVLVTGHHARIGDGAGGRVLLRGRDPHKDQSYVLHMLTRSELARVQLPVGELTKADVRAHAERLGLRTASKPDSQDICFVAGDYRDFLQQFFPEAARPGAIVDGSGKRLGSHRGTAGFTIGQRRGIGISAKEPLYVTSIDPASATVVVGPRAELRSAAVKVEGVSWVSGRAPAGPTAEVQVRYRAPAVDCLLEGSGTTWTAWFEGEAAAPGQAAVFYDGPRVLGGGTITEVVPGG